MMKKEDIAKEFKKLQEDICHALQEENGTGKFISDLWQRPEGGGGDTRVLQNGKIFEKAGVNFSAVHGPVTKKMNDAFGLNADEFYATGVSIVIHPSNPFVPIIHMNIRYFELPGKTWWFGGGIDLTPIYIDEREAKFFHGQLKNTCDVFDKNYYPDFKKWADDYFFIPHRNETRGIGGIFFDRLMGKDKRALFNFVWSVGKTFAPTYCHIVRDKKNTTYDKSHKEWQSIRRSRYVEFNLLYDKGTKFGLDTDGRTESILMSMPPMAEWHYNYTPKPGSEEEKTMLLLKKGKAWV